MTPSVHSKSDVQDETTIRLPLGGRTNANVLLAEDDDDLREAFAGALRAAAFDVQTATDGRHVFELLTAASYGDTPVPDVLVMDVRMPMTSGLDVLRAFKAAGWEQPVILVTAFPDDVLRKKAEELGAAAVLEKPIEGERLASVVDVLMSLRGKLRADSEPQTDLACNGDHPLAP